MTTYQIVSDTARTYALRNKETGQFEHQGFASISMAVSFYNLHFSWRPGYHCEGTIERRAA